MYSKILVTLDGSALAESVLPHAEAVAGKFGSELVLLQAVPSSLSVAVAYHDGVSTALLEELRQDSLKQAQAYIERQVAALTSKGFQVHGEVMEGEAVDCILQFADDEEVNLIAMATHGRSGLGRWVYGSVADRVLRGANQPVLLIRSHE